MIFLGVCVVLFALLCLPLLPWRHLRIKLTNVFGHIAGRGCLWFVGIRVPPGLSKQFNLGGPAIFVANHTSLVDAFVGIWLAPTGTCGVAKKELVYYPFLGQIWMVSGHLLVDRKNLTTAVEAMRKAASTVIKHGLGIWIWPEGTRSQDGRLQPFKKGFAHMALATRLPVVPVVITGVENAWKRGSLRLQRCTLDVRVLDPIPTADWSAETLDHHIAEVQARFQQALPLNQKALPHGAKRVGPELEPQAQAA